jgi:hypothetical protein
MRLLMSKGVLGWIGSLSAGRKPTAMPLMFKLVDDKPVLMDLVLRLEGLGACRNCLFE